MLPPGLIRELRAWKVVTAPEGDKPEDLEARKLWQQENNKMKKAEKATAEKLVARINEIKEEFRQHRR